MKQAGRRLDSFSSTLSPAAAYGAEHAVISTTRMGFQGNAPSGASGTLAPSATVLGNVSVGSGASVMGGAVVRGDLNPISIAEGASIGDNAVLHVDLSLKSTSTSWRKRATS